MLDEHESKKDGGEHAGLASLLEAATRRASLRERRGAVTIELPESACVVRRSDSAANESSPEEGDEDDRRRRRRGARRRMTRDLVERDAHVLASGGRNAGERAAAAARRHEAARLDVSLSVAAKAPRARVASREMMILAGELVGRFGAANDLPLPYRGQGDPVSVDVSGVPEGVPRAVLKRGGMRGASVGATRRGGTAGDGVAACTCSSPPRFAATSTCSRTRMSGFFTNGEERELDENRRVPFPDAAALEPVLAAVNERARDAKNATRDGDGARNAGSPPGGAAQSTTSSRGQVDPTRPETGGGVPVRDGRRAERQAGRRRESAGDARHAGGRRRAFACAKRTPSKTGSPSTRRAW